MSSGLLLTLPPAVAVTLGAADGVPVSSPLLILIVAMQVVLLLADRVARWFWGGDARIVNSALKLAKAGYRPEDAARQLRPSERER